MNFRVYGGGQAGRPVLHMLAGVLLACAPGYAATCAAGVTHVADTLLLQDGSTPARGKIAVKGPQIPGGSVVSSTVTITLGTDGGVDFCLAGGPGWKYDATFSLVDPATGRPTEQFTDRWIVGKTSVVQTRRMLLGGSSAPQFLISVQQLNPEGYAAGQGPQWDGNAWVPGNGGVGPTDPRLTDARTPTSHAGTHASGQADAITPAAIGAEAVDAKIVRKDAGGNVSIATTVVDASLGLTSPTVSRPQNTIVLFGDSITLANAATTVVNGNNTNIYYPQNGYFVWTNALLGQAFTVLNNAGVGGNSTAQMLARISTDVLAFKPGWCVVEGGVNDVAGDIASVTTIANLKAIYTALNAAGIKIVALTITPASSFTTAGRKAAWSEVNSWLKEYAKTANNFILVDTAAAYIDAANANPVPLTGMTTDGTHPSSNGAYAMGKLIAAALTGVAAPAVLPVWNGDTANRVANGLQTGTGGSVAYSATGPVATSWTMGGDNAGAACTASKGTRTDGLGATQIGTGTTGTYFICNQFQDVSAGWAVGDTVYLQLELVAATVTGSVIPYMQIGDGTHYWYVYANYSPGTTGNLSATLTRTVWRTPSFTIPAGANFLRINVTNYGATGSFEAGRVELRKVAP